jgi:hypothetical protein
MFEKLIENKKIGGVNCILWQDGQILAAIKDVASY